MKFHVFSLMTILELIIQIQLVTSELSKNMSKILVKSSLNKKKILKSNNWKSEIGKI